MKKYFASLLLLLTMIFASHTVMAQAPDDTPQKAITGLLNRIGGNGAADRFVTVIDAELAENGKDVFIITSQDGKPCIKGNNQLAVATGINWYLNHHAHINLTWNNLTTDLVSATLPAPAGEEKHVCNTTYRYNFNTCTFSYSMAFWTWERWQKEIDWMALHGINAPLNLVGLDVVTRNFLRELKVSETDINNYIAGPGFIAWFAMNNLEGWGSTVNETSVTMNGNPDWWYTRQEDLCKKMLRRMRELGMQPVIPGFSGQVPNCIANYNTIDGFNPADIVNNGNWAGGFIRPDILKPNTESYKTFAEIWYRHLEAVMGVSELYSMDPFHEGSLPSGVTNETCYPNIMAELDTYHNKVGNETKSAYNVSGNAKWIIQYWQNIPKSEAFSAMKSYGDRFIALDLFAENIYASNAAKWQTNYFEGRPYIYCMLHNFGGRSGMHGRFETTMNGYFEALAKGNNMQGVGATPEGIETNPILYDMLFELPWLDPDDRPTADEWLADYAHARYGVDNNTALAALQSLKKSVWNCQRNQQGTSEAIILGRPRWEFGDGERNDGVSLKGTSVSSWSKSSIYWDTQDVLVAADQLYSIKDLIESEDGIRNFNYDFIDVVRQSMVDYAYQLLPLIKDAYDKNNTAEYTRLYKLFLKLMLDLDEMLSYDENYKLERWTSLARNIADEAENTTENDRRWLEWNARTQVTVWSFNNSGLNDYSNRCWSSLIKDFHYPRWKYFFENNGSTKDGNWFTSEKAWTVDFDNYKYSTVTIPQDKPATEKAAETFGNYFGRVKGVKKNYIFPMGITSNATNSGVTPEIIRGASVPLPLEVKEDVTVSSAWIDLNGDGVAGNGETLTATGMNIEIPDDATIGKTTAQITFSDNTAITFDLAIVESIENERTVTVRTDGNGTVAIEGTAETSITNTNAVIMTATPNDNYNFKNWTDENGNAVSNDNPFTYYGKESATFTANFIQDKWGVPNMTESGLNDTKSNNQYVSKINFAYYNRNAETIYDASSKAPTSLFTVLPQIINVPQGASFTISWTDDNTQNLTKCFMSAYMDFNGNGDFEDEGELVKVVGTRNYDNAKVRNGSFQVILPYDAPVGITHLRMRFDSAWGGQYNSTTNAFNPKGELDRMCYEIVLNITDKSDKGATITVESNNPEWGTAEVWTEETPGWTASNKWVVSADVEAKMCATPVDEDAEFLGWYDHYGRLVSTNLAHTMYAREDATYTACFRKFLEIDGWQIEYRTVEGNTAVLTRLPNGETPEDGKTYYIYCDSKQSDNSYATRYLYDNNGTLATTTTANGDNYLWTCIDNGNGSYSFLNASGNYLANTSGYDLSIGSTPAQYSFEAAVHEGVSLLNATPGYTGSKFMVTKVDGTSFNHNSAKRNDDQWSSDYVFTEVSTPNGIILTKVRKSGNHDLVIPETFEILGETLTVVGFDHNLFNNNKELWSITLPKSIQTVSNNVVFSTSVKGTAPKRTAETEKTYNEDSKIIDLNGNVLRTNEAWTLNVEFESDGSANNHWGSFILSIGDNAFANEFLYLRTQNAWSAGIQLQVNGFVDNEIQNYFSNHTLNKCATFSVKIEHTADDAATFTVTNSEGTTLSKSIAQFNRGDIEVLSTAMPEGVNITKLEIIKEGIHNPFSGCSNLDAIAIDGDCANYKIGNDGGLYTSSDELVCLPEGKEKGADRRELSELIEKMKDLTAQVATYTINGKANKIALQTGDKNSANYLWANSIETSEGNIAHLVDGTKGNDGNFFHSNWHDVSTNEGYHYIEVDLGENANYSIMQFAYHTRTNCANDFPDAITVMGSNDKQNYNDLHTENQNLPQSVNQNFTSATFDSQGYRYLRFKVTAERTYWHMGEFELFYNSTAATVFKVFEGTELNNDFAGEKYDVLLSAIDVYDNGTTAAQMQAALTALQTAYDELYAKMKTVLPFELTIDEENPVLYRIIIKRANDGSKVLRYDNNDNMVAVGNKANNKTWQAWYFVNSTNGFMIKPYNAEGKVLSADNTSNSPAKVWATEKGKKAFYEWKLVARNDNYYNIQARDGSNYFSNNGGEDNKMGFWSGDPDTDGGSLFKFEEATFDNNNARFYQLNDIKETMPNGTNIYGGTSVGLYTGGKEYREAYTAAAEIITTGNTTDSAACYAACKALRETHKNLAYNAPAADKLYYIISAAGNNYCKGKYVYSPAEPTTRQRGNYTGTHDQKHLIFDNYADFGRYSLAAFQFIETGTQGAYKIKNLHTGLYVQAFAGTHMGPDSTAQVVQIAGYADGQVTLKIGNNAPMHAQQDYGVIVQWNAAANNASLWTIDEVEQLDQLNYTITVPESGVTTLNLTFDVVLPAGVTAYDVVESRIESTSYGLNKYGLSTVATAGETLAKNTPVIIKAAPGTYTFAYTATAEETKSATENSVMRGEIWQNTVEIADSKYLLNATENYAVFKVFEANGDATTVTIPANKCWAQFSENKGAVIYDDLVDFTMGGVYRIKSYVSNTSNGHKTHYLVNNNASIAMPTTVNADDSKALWVCTSVTDGNKVTFVSALGTAAFGWKGAKEKATEYTLSTGVELKAFTLTNGNNENLALTTEGHANNVAFNQTSNGFKTQSEHWSTDWYFEQVDDAEVAFTQTFTKDCEWSTLYLPYAVILPSDAGVTAYTATIDDVDRSNKVIRLTALDAVIPSYTAVLLNRENTAIAEYNFALTDDAEKPENIFEGCVMKTFVPCEDNYRYYLLLNNTTKGEAFYWVYEEYNAAGQLVSPGKHDGGHIKCDANKAFLGLEYISGASSSMYRFVIDDLATGIEDIEENREESIYDIQGRKLTKTAEKGLYIVNGKAVFVK